MQEQWPEGSLVVVLDDRLDQIDLPRDAMGVARDYRIGPASRALDDASQRDFTLTAQGVGLRPYRPAHLRARAMAGGDLDIGWIRRSREGGDAWGAGDIPLAEAYERYVLRVRLGGAVLREETLAAPGFLYTAAMQATDGAGAGFAVEVAQVSDVAGPGPFARVEVLL